MVLIPFQWSLFRHWMYFRFCSSWPRMRFPLTSGGVDCYFSVGRLTFLFFCFVVVLLLLLLMADVTTDDGQAATDANPLTTFEKKCVDDFDRDPLASDETLRSENERLNERAFTNFQNTASAVSNLYKGP